METELKKVVFTGTAPVDEFVNDKDSFIVHEGGGRIYDCAMN